MDVGNSPSTHASDFLENSSEHPRIEADVACHPGGVRKTSPASRPVGETHTCLNNAPPKQPQRRPPLQNRRSIWPSTRSSSAAIPIRSHYSAHTISKRPPASAGSFVRFILAPSPPPSASPIRKGPSKQTNSAPKVFLKQPCRKPSKTAPPRPAIAFNTDSPPAPPTSNTTPTPSPSFSVSSICT